MFNAMGWTWGDPPHIPTYWEVEDALKGMCVTARASDGGWVASGRFTVTAPDPEEEGVSRCAPCTISLELVAGL
jgi:hypothetical protein